ncbi:lysozyme inhibitor LprI family protein [Azospirillum doebereinerae]
MSALAFMGFLLHADEGQGASFDCNRATRPLDKLICTDPGLNRLDEEMGTTYRSGIEFLREPARANFVQQQRDWVRNRDAACPVTDGDLMPLSPKKTACLRSQYMARIETLSAQLEGAGEPETPPAPVPPPRQPTPTVTPPASSEKPQITQAEPAKPTPQAAPPSQSVAALLAAKPPLEQFQLYQHCFIYFGMAANTLDRTTPEYAQALAMAHTAFTRAEAVGAANNIPSLTPAQTSAASQRIRQDLIRGGQEYNQNSFAMCTAMIK